MDCSGLRRNMRLSIVEGALATSMGTLLSGVFLTGFALSLGAGPLEIGILAALPALSNVAQLAGSFWLERRGQRKSLCVGSLAASRIAWLPVLIIPFLPAGQTRLVVFGLVAIVALSSVLSAIGGVAWLSWIRDLIPQRERIGFLALRNQFDTVLALSLSIVGAAFADWWRSAYPGSSAGYAIVFGVGLFCGMVGIVLLNRIPDRGLDRAQGERFGKLLAAPLRENNFRKLLGFYSCWYLSANLAGPFFAVFMLQKLGLPLWQVTLLYTISSLTGLASSRFWSRLSQRYGAKPVVLLASAGEALFPLWWLFITPTTTWALPAVFLTGVFGSPLATGPNNLLLAIAPPRNATPHMAVFSSVIGPITALAAVLGGYMAESFNGAASLGFVSLDAIKLVFLVSLVGRIASLSLLRTLQEPGALSVWTLLGDLAGRRSVLPEIAGSLAVVANESPEPPAKHAA